MKKKFESLQNPMFKRLAKDSMTSIRGGLYTLCKTSCSDTLWGGDTHCGDSSKDADPQQ